MEGFWKHAVKETLLAAAGALIFLLFAVALFAVIVHAYAPGDLTVTVVGLVLGNGAYFFGRQLLGIYSSDPEVISYGLIRMAYLCVPYFTCGVMDVFVGSLRGMGYSIMPMLVSLTGACGFRILWIFTVFRYSHTLETLFVSYVISWVLTAAVHLICYCVAMHKNRQALLSAA